MSGRTLLDKVWDAHLVRTGGNDPDLLYIDLHLIHEISSPQAFDGLRLAGRRVRRPDLTLATEDHNVPTHSRLLDDPDGRVAIEALRRNCAEFGIRLLPVGDAGQGIVHVIAPERGLTQPGMTIVCGDSHTSTHGALGALAFGIGTSELEHVLATQTLPQRRPLTMAVTVEGALPAGVTTKDLVLTLISQVGTSAGRGHVVEYRGSTVRNMSVEARMTLCNMSIEFGARAGMVAPDKTTFDYLRGRPDAPTGPYWPQAVAHWSTLYSDQNARFDSTLDIEAAHVTPFVTWGTNPSQGAPVGGRVPDPSTLRDAGQRAAAERALAYMALVPGQQIRSIPIDAVFIGSCTNSRIEDLRAAADVLRGRSIASGVRTLVVPGSMAVKRQAEAEGLDEVFTRAGAEWRNSGCSMCIGLNADRIRPGQRCASTSNRNFEGRQGPGVRTHLVSPAVAAATAVAGHIAAPDDL